MTLSGIDSPQTMPAAEILADLACDDDLQGSIANLESVYLTPLELGSDVDPLIAYHISRVRDALSLAVLAVERLAKCKSA